MGVGRRFRLIHMTTREFSCGAGGAVLMCVQQRFEHATECIQGDHQAAEREDTAGDCERGGTGVGGLGAV
jgi:hypothetical protein